MMDRLQFIEAPRDDTCSESDALELEPSFTLADEQRELSKLTIREMISVNSDLHGIQAGVSNLSMEVSGGNANSAASLHSNVSVPHTILNHQATGSTVYEMDTTLGRLEQELSFLPPKQAAAYRKAEAKCPDQVSDERKMAFIERENGDIALAAKRIALYWEIRCATFGEERCFEPLTLAGAMRDEVLPMLNQRIWQRMPVPDTAGRSILYMQPNRRDFSVYSVEQEDRAFFYLLETIIEDPDLRRRGVIIVCDGRGMTRKHYSRKVQRLAKCLDKVFPIHLRAGHFCHPSNVYFYIIHPVVKHFLPHDVRLRFKIHYGSTAEVLRSLEGYCLPWKVMPTELGGDVTLDMNQWITARMAIEISRLLASSSLSTTSTASPAPYIQNGPNIGHIASSGSRSRGENEAKRFAPLSASSATIPTDKKYSAKEKKKKQHKASSTKPKKRTPGPARGKGVDPRMARAAQAKKNDPDLPLLDALVAGGFVFHTNSLTGEIIDEDGISLKQRRNHLCRRLRLDKQYEEKAKEQQGKEQKQQVEGKPFKRDSFYDQIASLPGIDDFVGDIDGASVNSDVGDF